MSESKTSARRILAAQRRTKALTLRKAGATFQAIGQALGCSEQRAHAIISQELARLNKTRAEEAAAVTRLELERLDALQLGVWQKALDGDLDCIATVVRLMQRRAALLGLDRQALLIGNAEDQPFKTLIGIDVENV
jgi:hypothetical protein